MVQIAGTYKIVKNENFAVYLKSIGATEELAQKAEKAQINLEITVDGNKYVINSSSGLNNMSFELDKEFDEPMPTGVVLKSIAKKEGDNKVIITSRIGDRVGTRTYIFGDSSLIIELTADGVSAKRTFERV